MSRVGLLPNSSSLAMILITNRQMKHAMSLEVPGTEAHEGYGIDRGQTEAEAHEEEAHEDRGGYGDDVLPLT